MKTSFPLAFGTYLSIEHPKVSTPTSDPKKNSYPIAYKLYKDSYQAIRIRFDSCVVHEKTFSDSYKKKVMAFHDDGEVAIQNNALYSFFMNAHSFFESFYFMMFTLGAMAVNKKAFNVEEHRISPGLTKALYLKYFPNDAITKDLSSILSSKNYQRICNMRNILSHRCQPSRIMRLDGRLNSPQTRRSYMEYMDNTHQTYEAKKRRTLDNFELSDDSLLKLLKWIAKQRDVLCIGYDKYINAHFSPTMKTE